MYGQKPSRSAAQLARAQALTREAVKRAGSDIFPDAREYVTVPRGRRDEDVFEGGGTKFVAAMPINPARQAAGLGEGDRTGKAE